MSTAPFAVLRHGLTRRTALVSVALGVLSAGCTSRGADPEGAPAREPSPEQDLDVVLAAAVLAHEQTMLDAVQAAQRRHPQLRRMLSNTRATHEQHVQLLSDASPSEAGGSEQTQAVVARDPKQAMLALSRRENRLSLVNKRSSFSAESGAFARLLASMAAAAAQQAVVLGQYAPTEPINP